MYVYIKAKFLNFITRLKLKEKYKKDKKKENKSNISWESNSGTRGAKADSDTLSHGQHCDYFRNFYTVSRS